MDYAKARYDASAQGRFLSVDPLLASADVLSPQSFNRYSYVENNPLNLTDPSGLIPYSGADRSFADVSDRFWGGGFDFSRPHPSRGRIIIAAAMFVHDMSIAVNMAELRAAEIRRQQYRKKLSGLSYLFSNLPNPFSQFAHSESSDSAVEVSASAEVTGLLCQDFCSPQGDGPYVVKLPAGFGSSTGRIAGKVGDGDCAVLAQTLMEGQGEPMGLAGAGRFRRGPAVMGNNDLRIGTVIGSGWHRDGYYPNYRFSGNHIAIFLGFVPGGFRVLEQLKGQLWISDKANIKGSYFSNPYAYNVVLTGPPIPNVPYYGKH